MPQFPDVKKLTAALAGDNRLVAKFVESLERRVDDIVEAARDGDWEEVGRIGRYIARSSRRYGEAEVAQAAENVCRLVESTGSETDIRTGLVGLVGSCDRARENRR